MSGPDRLPYYKECVMEALSGLGRADALCLSVQHVRKPADVPPGLHSGYVLEAVSQLVREGRLSQYPGQGYVIYPQPPRKQWGRATRARRPRAVSP